jgi:hypothetical protein
MDNKYIEKIEIKDIIYYAIQKNEPVLTLKVKDFFISSFDPLTNDEFIIGKTLKATFSLLTKKVNKINLKNKYINVDLNRPGYICYCSLCGELVDIISNGNEKDQAPYYQNGIVDCGIYVRVEIPFNIEINVGDYLCAEGRLDVKMA